MVDTILMLNLWKGKTYNESGLDVGDENSKSFLIKQTRDDLRNLNDEISSFALASPWTKSRVEVKKDKQEKLTKKAWVFNWPSGRETYYDLDMKGVVKNMRKLGYSKEKYEFKIREDGVKMLGDYVIIAANVKIKGRERGKVLNTSLWKWIVCDTGSFTTKHPTWIDIATDWTQHKYKWGWKVDDENI